MSPRCALGRALARAMLCAASGVLALIGAGGALAATPATPTTPATGARLHHIDWVGNEGASGGSIGDRSVSYSTWSLSGDTFIVRYLTPISDAERVADTAIEVLVQQRLGDYLLARLAVRAGTQACPAIDQGYDIGRIDPLTVASGLYGFEIFFRCPSGAASDVVLENHALFDRIHGHVDFARVQINGGPVRQQLFTARHEQLALGPLTPRTSATPAPGTSARGTSASSAGIGRYLGLGIGNVLGSPDRLCFLLGMLLLMLTRPRPTPRLRAWPTAMLYAITGLAAGYALSLLAALAAGLAPRERLLDAAVGFLVALLAAGVATRDLVRARLVGGTLAGALLCLAALIAFAHGRFPALLLAGAGVFAGCQLALAGRLELRPALFVPALFVPALFGFLDGFVLPAEVLPMQLPARTVLPMAVGFDLGALLMEIAVLAALAGALALVGAWPRMRPLARHSALSTDLAAAALGCVGVFWMLSRLHG
jgi:hypothetical protein